MWFGKALLKLLSFSYSYRLIVLIGQGKNSLEKRQTNFDITSKWREIYSCQSNFRTSYHKRKRVYHSDQCFTRCADLDEINLGASKTDSA